MPLDMPSAKLLTRFYANRKEYAQAHPALSQKLDKAGLLSTYFPSVAPLHTQAEELLAKAHHYPGLNSLFNNDVVLYRELQHLHLLDFYEKG